MSYDLFLQSRHGTLLPLNQGKQLLEDFRRETSLDGPCEITDLMDESFDFPSDIDSVEEGLRNGEFTQGEYDAFCSKFGLLPCTDQETAMKTARLFLDYEWGQKLFSLTLPISDEESREAYRLIVVEFTRRHGLVVHDPQVGRDIDLENPGEFPPMWEPKKRPPSRKRGWFW